MIIVILLEYPIFSAIKELHQSVRDGRELGDKIQNNADLNIGEWTIGGLTLIHVASEAGNFQALEQLILKVMFLQGYLCGLLQNFVAVCLRSCG